MSGDDVDAVPASACAAACASSAQRKDCVIETLVPPAVVTFETRAELLCARLFPCEEPTVARAVPKRRREFATGRACARRALARLNVPPVGIPAGADGEPVWPPGVVGSITHCDGYRACAVAASSHVATIGIDAEPAAALPGGVLEAVASPIERSRLRRATDAACLDRVLFSAKEAVFKAWFALTRTRLGFDDADVAIAPEGSFRARLGTGEALPGRWCVDEGLVLTAAWETAA